MDWLTTLGVIALVLYVYLHGRLIIELKLIQKRAHKYPTERLKKVISGSGKFYLYGPAIQELDRRGKDISFAFPVMAESCLHGKFGARLIAWSIIQSKFQGIADGIEYVPSRPSKEAKEMLASRLGNFRAALQSMDQTGSAG